MNQKQVVSDPLKRLCNIIYDLHGCASEWLESVPIKEMFGNDVVWEGVVEVFKLIDHATADKCYAWSYETDEGKMKYVAVLHQDPVRSPIDAVRAFIVSDSKKKL